MISVEEKFPMMFGKNDDFSKAGQLFTEAASSSPKYDFKKGDVVLVALSKTDDLWSALIGECIAQKLHVILPANNRDAAYIAQIIREEKVSVLAISSVLWPAVFKALNARPEYITRMQVIIADGKGNIETRFSLMPSPLTKTAKEDPYGKFHLALALRKKAG